VIYEYKTLLTRGQDEIIIEKSRFIAYSMPIKVEQDAVAFIESIKTKHKDATHNVPAYVAGLNNEIQRYSDDGEPSGTAGIPMLEVIKKEDLRNVAVVVTRYFGGIKLGAGGLVRAYTSSAKIGIESGKIIFKKYYQTIKMQIEYTLLGKIQNDIIHNGYTIKEIIYSESVDLYIFVPFNEVDLFKGRATEWTNARCNLIDGEKEYLTVIDGKIVL